MSRTTLSCLICGEPWMQAPPSDRAYIMLKNGDYEKLKWNPNRDVILQHVRTDDRHPAMLLPDFCKDSPIKRQRRESDDGDDDEELKREYPKRDRKQIKPTVPDTEEDDDNSKSAKKPPSLLPRFKTWLQNENMYREGMEPVVYPLIERRNAALVLSFGKTVKSCKHPIKEGTFYSIIASPRERADTDADKRDYLTIPDGFECAVCLNGLVYVTKITYDPANPTIPLYKIEIYTKVETDAPKQKGRTIPPVFFCEFANQAPFSSILEAIADLKKQMPPNDDRMDDTRHNFAAILTGVRFIVIQLAIDDNTKLT